MNEGEDRNGRAYRDVARAAAPSKGAPGGRVVVATPVSRPAALGKFGANSP